MPGGSGSATTPSGPRSHWSSTTSSRGAVWARSCSVRSLSGVLMVEIPTMLTPDALRRFDEREEHAAAAALRKVLAPRSVAVIGASRRRGTVGGELFHNLLAAGFTGPVYPVNPKAAAVQSVPAYPT